jgi:hypothetical protein
VPPLVGRQHLAAGEPVETLFVGMAMPTYAERLIVGRQYLAAESPDETPPVGMVMPTYAKRHLGRRVR